MFLQNVFYVELFVFLFFFVFCIYVEKAFFLLNTCLTTQSDWPIDEIIWYDTDENENVGT